MFLSTPPITITRVGILAGPRERDGIIVYHSLISFAIRTKVMLLEHNSITLLVFDLFLKISFY